MNSHRHNVCLQSLDLVRNRISDRGASAIGTGLWYVTVHYFVLVMIFFSLCVMFSCSLLQRVTSTVDSVILFFFVHLLGAVDNPILIRFVYPHSHNASLQTLDLRDNRIGDVGSVAIGEGLRCVVDHCV